MWPVRGGIASRAAHVCSSGVAAGANSPPRLRFQGPEALRGRPLVLPGTRSLIEFRAVPAVRSLRARITRSLALVPVVFVALQGVARAAEVVITPNASA